VDQILDEARRLIAAGVKELNLVAQDTTFYGHDLSEPVGFDTLLVRLAELAGHLDSISVRTPGEHFRQFVIEVVATHRQPVPYFDLPVQHAATNVLKKMGRNYDKRQLLDLFGRIRARFPGPHQNHPDRWLSREKLTPIFRN
jgi:ribosomal protein S12 methylthiotransferase